MTEPKFKIGDEVFVHDPSRYVKDARALIGFIDKVIPMGSSFKYEFQTGDIAIDTKPGQFKWAKPRRVSIHEIDLGHRMGTPLAGLVAPNGQASERFVEIGNSWGYP